MNRALILLLIRYARNTELATPPIEEKRASNVMNKMTCQGSVDRIVGIAKIMVRTYPTNIKRLLSPVSSQSLPQDICIIVLASMGKELNKPT